MKNVYVIQNTDNTILAIFSTRNDAEVVVNKLAPLWNETWTVCKQVVDVIPTSLVTDIGE